VADSIVVATAPADYEVFGLLIREYWEWLRSRYADMVDAIGDHQGLTHELDNLPTVYGPPRGKTLLAFRGREVVGGIAYRDLGDGACEMKRLFVPVRFQGRGTGRLLCQALIDAATADGYDVMRLDTGEQNSEALAMYRALGFQPCPAYHEYPPHLMAHLIFLEKPLRSAGGADTSGTAPRG
jgi:ribosomal protein S18 acetylase RimI-like enzyme